MRRSLSLGVCLVAVIVATVAVPTALAHETPPPYPDFEPNDGFDEATPIEPRTLHGLKPIKYTNRSPGPAVQKPSGMWTLATKDEDYYAVELDRGDALPVTLYHYGEDGNLRFSIHDPSRTEIASVDPDGNWQRTGSSLGRTSRAIQRGAHTVTARCSGTYYVRVRNDGDTHAPYRLEVDDRYEHNDFNHTKARRISSGDHEDLAITTYDRDYYALRVRKGEQIDAVVDLTTQAHWEQQVAIQAVPVGDETRSGDWAPYDHPRWADPSFQFHSAPAGLNESGDYDVRSVSQVTYDGLHRAKASLDVTETGTIYLYLTSSPQWKDGILGASKWTANAARYDLTVTRSGTPTGGGATDDASDDGGGHGGSSVRKALERVDAEASDAAPGLAAGQLAGERVTLQVAGAGAYSFDVTEDLGIANVTGCGNDDATVRIETDDATLDRIEGSDSPKTALVEAYGRGDLRVEGVGTVNRVKWGVVNGVAGLAGKLPF